MSVNGDKVQLVELKVRLLSDAALAYENTLELCVYTVSLLWHLRQRGANAVYVCHSVANHNIIHWAIIVLVSAKEPSEPPAIGVSEFHGDGHRAIARA